MRLFASIYIIACCAAIGIIPCQCWAVVCRYPKKRSQVKEAVDCSIQYTVKEAISLVKKYKYANFDESVDVAVRLGVNPQHADQVVRGALVLPHGVGKVVRVLVFAKSSEKQREARDAGADFVGSDDLLAKVSDGFLGFDRVIATPDMMGSVGKLGRVLGPRGLMPNPKVGTVTSDIALAVQEVRAGKIQYRTEKAGIVHTRIGKVSFIEEHLVENLSSFVEALLRQKPASARGAYLRSLTVSSTMGPGFKVVVSQFALRRGEV